MVGYTIFGFITFDLSPLYTPIFCLFGKVMFGKLAEVKLGLLCFVNLGKVGVPQTILTANFPRQIQIIEQKIQKKAQKILRL